MDTMKVMRGMEMTLPADRLSWLGGRVEARCGGEALVFDLADIGNLVCEPGPDGRLALRVTGKAAGAVTGRHTAEQAAAPSCPTGTDGSSGIVWCAETWNPALGCSKCSDGCKECYAIPLAYRWQHHKNPAFRAAYEGLTRKLGKGLYNWTGTVRPLPERLADPFTDPRMAKNVFVFVNSMSDLFHEDLPDDYVKRVFAVMEAAPWLSFQVLTKRAERLEALAPELPWPANVLMGVSVENQENSGRIAHLRRTPARVKWLSVEPMLGPVDLDLGGIDWVVTGGESGPRHRPFDPAWAAAVRDQCRAAGGVTFLHKQNGGRTPNAKGRVLDGRTHDDMPPLSTAPVPPRRERMAMAARLVPETVVPEAAGRTPLPTA